MPNPLNTIVAATDFSFSAHRAAMRAGMLAKAHGASLQLLHVIDSATTRSQLSGTVKADIQALIHRDAQQALQLLAEDVAKVSGIVPSAVIREGGVLDEILSAAKQSDLLVLGPRGVNPLRDLFLGATAERIARMIPCPMLVVKQESNSAYEHVLVPVDFSKSSVSALSFAAKLLPNAALHVFHAVDSSAAGTLRNVGVSDEAVLAYHEGLVREATASLDELTAGVTVRTSIARVGDARVLLERRATQLDCTLMVIGKQGRSWVADQLVGSITRLMLERSACDVLVVPENRS